MNVYQPEICTRKKQFVEQPQDHIAIVTDDNFMFNVEPTDKVMRDKNGESRGFYPVTDVERIPQSERIVELSEVASNNLEMKEMLRGNQIPNIVIHNPDGLVVNEGDLERQHSLDQKNPKDSQVVEPPQELQKSKEDGWSRLLKLYGMGRECAQMNNGFTFKNIFKATTASPVPVSMDSNHSIRCLARFVNLLISIVTSGLVIGKMLVVLSTWASIELAEGVQSKKDGWSVGWRGILSGVWSVGWRGILGVVCYIFAMALACVSTVFTTDSPLAHLKEINTKLPRNLLKFADRFAQVLRITVQVFFALTCISIILLVNGGSGIAFIMALQALLDAPVIGLFVSFTATWVLGSSALLATISAISIAALSIWGFFAGVATVRFTIRKIREIRDTRFFSKKWKLDYANSKQSLLTLSASGIENLAESEMVENMPILEHKGLSGEDKHIERTANHIKVLCNAGDYLEARQYLRKSVFEMMMHRYNSIESIDRIKNRIYEITISIKNQMYLDRVLDESTINQKILYDLPKLMGSIFAEYKAVNRMVKTPIWNKILTFILGDRKRFSSITQIISKIGEFDVNDIMEQNRPELTREVAEFYENKVGNHLAGYISEKLDKMYMIKLDPELPKEPKQPEIPDYSTELLLSRQKALANATIMSFEHYYGDKIRFRDHSEKLKLLDEFTKLVCSSIYGKQNGWVQSLNLSQGDFQNEIRVLVLKQYNDKSFYAEHGFGLDRVLELKEYPEIKFLSEPFLRRQKLVANFITQFEHVVTEMIEPDTIKYREGKQLESKFQIFVRYYPEIVLAKKPNSKSWQNLTEKFRKIDLNNGLGGVTLDDYLEIYYGFINYMINDGRVDFPEFAKNLEELRIELDLQRKEIPAKEMLEAQDKEFMEEISIEDSSHWFGLISNLGHVMRQEHLQEHIEHMKNMAMWKKLAGLKLAECDEHYVELKTLSSQHRSLDDNLKNLAELKRLNPELLKQLLSLAERNKELEQLRLQNLLRQLLIVENAENMEWRDSMHGGDCFNELEQLERELRAKITELLKKLTDFEAARQFDKAVSEKLLEKMQPIALDDRLVDKFKKLQGLLTIEELQALLPLEDLSESKPKNESKLEDKYKTSWLRTASANQDSGVKTQEKLQGLKWLDELNELQKAKKLAAIKRLDIMELTKDHEGDENLFRESCIMVD